MNANFFMNTSPAPRKDYLAQLNPEQRKAVEQIEGPVMVLAGPGTGKTQMLTSRIAHILNSADLSAHNILALTFSDAAVTAMKDRLVGLIGPVAHEVTISTYHAFAQAIISEHQDELGISLRKSASQLMQAEIIRKILSASTYHLLSPSHDPEYYEKSILTLIQTMKREGVSPVELIKLIQDEQDSLPQEPEKPTKGAADALRKQQNKLKMLREFQEVYAQYQTALRDAKTYDFDDMLIYAVDLLKKDPILLGALQEKYQYVLIDEFQDTNSIQYELIDLLTEFWGDQANLFAVGDPDQTIYRFQGASTENLKRFQARFPNALIIQLQTNYRSRAEILEASQALISHNTYHALTTPLQVGISRSDQQQTFPAMRTALFSSEWEEHVWIATEIDRLLKSGVLPEKIAVLSRKNDDLGALQELLQKHGVPSWFERGLDAAQHPSTQQLLTLLQTISGLSDQIANEQLFLSLSFSWIGVEYADLLALSWNTKSGKSLWQRILSEEWKSWKLKKPGRIAQLAEDFMRWSQRKSELPLSYWIREVINESGYINHLLEDDSGERIAVMRSFLSQIDTWESEGEIKTMDALNSRLALMRAHLLTIPVSHVGLTSSTVTLCSIHKAKGMEWDYVFLMNCSAKSLDRDSQSKNLKPPEGMLKFESTEELDPEHDRRRLLYVAITRARLQITLSTPNDRGSTGKSLSYPSKLLLELPKHLISSVEIPPTSKQLQEFAKEMFAPPVTLVEHDDWIRELTSKINLSASALNTYLECAYKFKLQNLLRVPQTISATKSYGTAIHKALEKFAKLHQTHKSIPSKSFLLESFTKAFEQTNIPQSQREQYFKQGLEHLSDLYDQHAVHWAVPAHVELTIGQALGSIKIDDISINGKIDRVDWVDEKEKTIQVLDYKSGGYKHPGQFRGKDPDHPGKDYAQIMFYALLLSLHPSLNYRFVQGSMLYLKPYQGEIKSQTWKYSEPELDRFKDLIRTTMKNIRSLKFDRTTDLKVCADCPFKQHCWPDGVPSSPDRETLF